MQAVTLQHNGPVSCCRTVVHDDLGESPMVAAGIDRSVTMHHGKKVVATFDGIATPVSAIGMDKQARRVAVGTDGGSLKLWDMSTGEVIQGFTRGHRTVVTAIDYHPFADFMATASRDTHVRIWDLRKKSCLQTYRHEDGVAAPVEVVRVAPDGRTAASGCDDGAIRMYDLRGGKPGAVFRHHTAPISSIAIHPSRQMLAACDTSGVASLWDLEESKLIFSTQDTGGAKHCALVEGSLIVCSENLVKRFSVPSFEAGTPKPVRSGGSIGDVYTTSAGKIYIAGINGGAINLTSLSVRAGASNTGGSASKPTSKRVLSSGLLAAAAANQGAQPPSHQQRTRSEPRVVSHTAGASGPGKKSDVPPEHLQPLSAVVPPVPQSQAVAAAAERVVVPQKRPSPPRPAAKVSKPSSSGSPTSAKPAVDIIELSRRGEKVTALMERRVTHTRMLRSQFGSRVDNTFKLALELLHDDGATNDSGAVVGLMHAISTTSRAADRITLETLVPAMRIADAILQRHSQARYVASSVEFTRVLWVRHRMAINDLRRASRVAVGVDLSLEARMENANAAMQLFASIKESAKRFITQDNEAGEAVRKFFDAFED